MKRRHRFMIHLVCLWTAAAVVLGAIGVTVVGYAGWALVNIAIAAAWWPVFDLVTEIRS